MEMPCGSVRKAEEDSRRPNSCKFVELHVLCVPAEQWNVKLNKVPTEATESFISAGFIRVYPDITLKTLRRDLDALFDNEGSISKYSFLKCVGRSLALVKSKQERDLKVKTFAPPYAAQPELYLLAMERGNSFCSQSFTPDTSSSSSDQQTHYQPSKACSQPIGTKDHVKFPHIPQSSQQPPPTSGPEEEEEEEDYEEDEEDPQTCISSEEENDEEALCSIRRADQECCKRKVQNERALQLVSLKKALEVDPGKPYRWGSFTKTNHCHKDQDSGAAESLEDRDSGSSLADRVGKSKDAHMLKLIRNKAESEMSKSPAVLSRPVRCSSPLGLNVATVINKAATAPPVFHTNRETLIKEIKLVKEERKQLEWTRQELLRKGKDLLAQNRHRRNQARDSWKKRYFETKKATVPLEDNLKHLRQELDTFYNKLLHQLQVRENRGKPRRQGRPSVKNELIIQIITLNYEIDNLKRKVEDAKMKLITEIKLRTQAAAELRALKAELAQKKSQSSHPALMGNP